MVHLVRFTIEMLVKYTASHIGKEYFYHKFVNQQNYPHQILATDVTFVALTSESTPQAKTTLLQSLKRGGMEGW